MEEWKDIVGYEGLYQVSNYGRVKHLTQTHKNRFGECVKQEHTVGYRGSNGYMYVVLHKNNKPHTVTIHSLVAKAFIPNPNGYECINHIDETHDNNNADNLEWCDKEYNNNYGTLSERKRVIMLNHPKTSKPVWCMENNVTFASAREAARHLDVCPSNIINCCNGKQHTCKGFHFMYADNIEKGLALKAPEGMYNVKTETI